MRFMRLLLVLGLWAALAWPLAVYAQGETGHTIDYVNPAPWIGWFMVILALVIPIVTSMRVRGARG